MTKTIAALALLAVAAACGGSDSSGNATVAITSPQPGASIALGTDAQQSVPVAFTLTGFTLKPPGTCGGVAGCGHLHLVIDTAASACNGSPGIGTDRYNVQVTSGTTALAQFATCGSGATGTHSLTLELADDTHHLLGVQATVSNLSTH